MDMRIRPNIWPRPAHAAAAPGHQPAAAASFRLPPGPGATQAASAPNASAATAPLLGAVNSPRDQVARKRGRALLGGLASLQRELLGGAADAGALQRLASLLEGEDGEDPALAEAMRGVALRARIELLRRGISRADDPESLG